MTNATQIASLKQKIKASLLPLIDQDYSLLDVPNYNNIGDSLIYEGELAFLKEVPFKKLFSASRKFASLKRIPREGMILMQGGGNFGDLWRAFQDFRLKVIASRKDQKIVLFPQTVHYESEAVLLKDAEVFNEHPDLTICARDQRSYELLKKYFWNNKIILVPDMAFYLDLSSWVRKEPTGKILLLERRDKEAPAVATPLISSLLQQFSDKQLEKQDWPGIESSSGEQKYWASLKKKNKYMTRIKLLWTPARKVNLDFGVLNLFNSSTQLELGCAFINEYDVVISTRLHGAILAILLGKPVYMLDNSYGKNSQFFTTWLRDFDDCRLIR